MTAPATLATPGLAGTPDLPPRPAGVPDDLWGIAGLADDLAAIQRPLTPMDVETALRLIQLRLQRSAAVVAHLDEEHKAARRLEAEDEARGYLDRNGPHSEKRAAGILAGLPAREVADLAEVKLRYAKRLADALSDEVRVFQSIGAHLRQVYAMPQNGRGA